MSKNYITKVKNQFKSSAYYMFWGTATFAVVAGQLYVGSGYRQMSKSLDAWFDDNPLKDTEYIEKPVYESCEIPIHKLMYDFATRMLSQIGGSENVD